MAGHYLNVVYGGAVVHRYKAHVLAATLGAYPAFNVYLLPLGCYF